MTRVSSLLETIAYVFSLVFPFWPLIILAQLKWRRHILYNMLAVWGFLAVARLFVMVFIPQPLPSFLIPEPLNTVLFFAAGVLLIGLQVGRTFLQRREFQRKTGGIRDVEDLLKLSPREFEDMVVEMYRAFGYKARRTGATGDHGVDVVIETPKGRKFVAQCKQWRGSVGEPVVRDFYGVVLHEKADRGIIFTTGKFTHQAREWAKGKPIYLCDGREFLKVWNQAQARKHQNRPEAA